LNSALSDLLTAKHSCTESREEKSFHGNGWNDSGRGSSLQSWSDASVCLKEVMRHVLTSQYLSTSLWKHLIKYLTKIDFVSHFQL